jgi:hypothetical protein
MKTLVMVALAALSAACVRSNVECVDDSSCNLTAGGRCVGNDPTGASWCAYPDADCGSGLRWSDFDVGDSVGGTCVVSPGGESHTLSVTIDGAGIVTSDPVGIDCSLGTCTADFPAGSRVRLVATASATATFVGFTEACVGTTCTLTMQADASVTASFVPRQCEANSVTCAASILNECDENGESHPRNCLLGCHPSGTRCYDLSPSNGGSTASPGMIACLDDSAFEADHSIPDGATIDTDTGAITLAGGGVVNVPSMDIVAPRDGVPVRCFRAGNLSIGNVSVVGGRALAFATSGVVTLHGALSISAKGPGVSGPGAMTTCSGGNGGAAAYRSGGGGGGGFGSNGAPGGSAREAAGGPGGQMAGNAELVPLRGGCRGGTDDTGLARHNGGGAIQLVSRAGIQIETASAVIANGAGGAASTTDALLRTFGGGSGGAILLEAPSVQIAVNAFLLANGGGGAGAVDGSPPPLTGEPAVGGQAGAVGGLMFAKGGDGATAGAEARRGENVADNVAGGGGGGGGGTGRIRINSYEAFVAPTNAVVSPAPSVGELQRR